MQKINYLILKYNALQNLQLNYNNFQYKSNHELPSTKSSMKSIGGTISPEKKHYISPRRVFSIRSITRKILKNYGPKITGKSLFAL